MNLTHELPAQSYGDREKNLTNILFKMEDHMTSEPSLKN